MVNARGLGVNLTKNRPKWENNTETEAIRIDHKVKRFSIFDTKYPLPNIRHALYLSSSGIMIPKSL